ncbi:MAG: O-antigen ligase family protein [Thermoanaerobaculia bacterium]
MSLDQPQPAEERPTSRHQNVGFWLFTLHLLTVWGLALSNIFQGLTLLWTIRWWRDLRFSTASLRAAGGDVLIKPFVFYVAVFIASALTSYQLETSLWELWELIGLTTLPLALLLVRGERRVRLVFDLLIWVTLALAVYGIAQYLFTDYGELSNRIPGPFGHYMTYSGVVLLGACLVLGRVMTRPPAQPAKNWPLLAVILIALGLTLTRNVWLAMFVVITIAFFMRFRRWLPAYAVTVALLLSLLATQAPQHWSRLTSIASLQDPSNYDRLCMAEAGLHMIADRPLFGIGPGMVEFYYPIYRHPTALRAEVMHLHNTVLQLAAERGLLSVGAYLWLMIAALWLCHRGYQRGGGLAGPRADLYLGVMLALVALNIAGIFEANWRDTEVQRWALFLLAVPVCLDNKG